MNRVAITTTSFGEYDAEPLNLLKRNGFEAILNLYGRKRKKDEIVELCNDAIGIIAGTEILDVNLDTATRLGIKVCNTPDAPTLAVAELAIGLKD